MNATIDKLRAAGRSVFVFAPTGIAGVNVGGTTIHSFADIGTGTKGTHELISIIQAKEEARKRWEQCYILVFDEVSMLSRELSE